MFTTWLQQDVASWDQLLEALRSPSVQLEYLANQIEQMLDNDNDNHGKKMIVKCHGSA